MATARQASPTPHRTMRFSSPRPRREYRASLQVSFAKAGASRFLWGIRKIRILFKPSCRMEGSNRARCSLAVSSRCSAAMDGAARTAIFARWSSSRAQDARRGRILAMARAWACHKTLFRFFVLVSLIGISAVTGVAQQAPAPKNSPAPWLIVLPPKLVAGDNATLAVLDHQGQLMPRIDVT